MQPPDTYYLLLRLFSEKTCVKKEELGGRVVEELVDLEVIYTGISGELCVKSMVQLAIASVKRGCDPKKVSTYLSWKDFESFVAEALVESGFEVFKNFRFGMRRWEFDVLAVNAASSLGVVVDCKHWSPKYSNSYKVKEVSIAHLEKLRRFLDWCSYGLPNCPTLRKAKEFLGLVVTLSEQTRGSVEGIGMVPIYYFRDFIGNIRYYVEELKIATLRNPCYVPYL